MQKRVPVFLLITVCLVFLALLESAAITSKRWSNQGNLVLSRALGESITLESSWPFFSVVYLRLDRPNAPAKRLLFDAGESFELSRQIDPMNLRALAGLARTNAFLAKLALADGYYKQLLAQDTSDKIVIEESAQVAFLLGDQSRAFKLWSLERSAFGPYYAGLYFKEKQDWIRAEQQLLMAVQAQPENATAHFYLCVAQKSLERSLKSALAHCEESVRLDPQSMYKRSFLASLLAEAGELDSALEQARIATQLTADPVIVSTAYLTLGRLLIEKGNVDEAIAALRQSATLTPNARAYYWLGIAYKRNGQKMEAIYALRQSLALEADFSPAELELNKLESGE